MALWLCVVQGVCWLYSSLFESHDTCEPVLASQALLELSEDAPAEKGPFPSQGFWHGVDCLTVSLLPVYLSVQSQGQCADISTK